MNNDHFCEDCHNLLDLEGTLESIIEHALCFIDKETEAQERK